MYLVKYVVLKAVAYWLLIYFVVGRDMVQISAQETRV
jgi:hypothetical protein